jgi:chromosome partitioning protein
MVLSIVNHKGGTGKTTTTVNLGSVLASEGFSTLLVDLDAQGSLSYALGLGDTEHTIAEALVGEVPPRHALNDSEGMFVLSANTSLADVELAMARSESRFGHVKMLLNELPSFDFVLIDCPPSLSLLTLNALVASHAILIPMQLDALALRGLDSMLDTVEKVHSLNPQLTILGILPVMVDPRRNICREISNFIKANYSIKLFQTSIHSNVKAAEAPSFGKSIIRYAPSSSVANDYREFTKEFLNHIQVTHN